MENSSKTEKSELWKKIYNITTGLRLKEGSDDALDRPSLAHAMEALFLAEAKAPMKLGEFIKKFVRPNSLIRLVYNDKTGGGHKGVLDNWDEASMEWEILKGEGKNRHYINNQVIGITDIGGMGRNSEAINIVIEELYPQPMIEEVIEEKSTNSETI